MIALTTHMADGYSSECRDQSNCAESSLEPEVSNEFDKPMAMGRKH